MVGVARKKLTEVAQLIYGSATISKDLIEDLMAEGELTRANATARAAKMMGFKDETLTLPETDRDVVQLALATVGKWRILARMNGNQLLGFDLGEIDIARDWMGIDRSKDLLEGIGIIERAALKILGDT